MNKLLNLAFVFLFLGAGNALAQDTSEKNTSGRIIGVAKDLKSGEPISYAIAALYKLGSDVSTSGAVADGDGVFYITGYELGEYQLIGNRNQPGRNRIE